MKIKQIGNGGAFNYKETNSSFLIENNRKYLLFDCGHSVYQKLRELEEASEISLKDLKAVYISHFDDDHIGSLKTLIYYQYFINNIIMDVIVAEDLYQEMNYFLRDLDGYNDNFEKVSAQMFDIYSINNYCELYYNDMTLTTISCNHHIDCFGLQLRNEENDKMIIISGDTTAIDSLDESYFYEKSKNPDAEILVFHDFSNWDCPEKQVHMCKTNMEEMYNQDFIKVLNFYHNDDLNYNKEWR